MRGWFPPKRQFSAWMPDVFYSAGTVVFVQRPELQPRWSIRLTTVPPDGIRRRHPCGPQPERLLAVALLLHPLGGGGTTTPPPPASGNCAAAWSASQVYTGGNHRERERQPTTRRTGGRRVMILPRAVGLLEADSRGTASGSCSGGGDWDWDRRWKPGPVVVVETVTPPPGSVRVWSVQGRHGQHETGTPM